MYVRKKVSGTCRSIPGLILHFQINNSANVKPKDIIEAAVSIKCVYSGEHSSNITVFTNSFPEPSGTRAQKSDMKVIQVPGKFYWILFCKFSLCK